uniref:Uncharacterized protein n=1 Tax=Pseudomonas phage HRDY3 TaxID=3236930 RepID=A0AB39CEM5_9VIRU
MANLTGYVSLDYFDEVEKCKQQKEWGHIRDVRDTKRDRDVMSPDGIVYYGQRIVSKDGSVRFAGAKWQTELLLPFAGFEVGLMVWDYWISKICCYRPHYPTGRHMFDIYSECEGDRERNNERLLLEERIQELNEMTGGPFIKMPGLKMVKGRE